MSEEKKYKLDIFKVLSQLESGDLHIWEKLSDEERKGFSGYIIIRWMSGTADPGQLIYVNELANRMLFKLGGRSLKLDHTELMAKLLACCGTKSRKRFTWVPEGKKSSRPLAFAVVEEYFDYTIKETKEMLTVIENDDIMTYAEELGWEPAELKKLKKELEK